VTEDLRNDLSQALDKYDARRNADVARQKKSRDDDARFLARFAELRRDVVRPVFEEAGALLAGRGHAFAIVEEEFVAAAGAVRVREARITLSIAPAGMGPPLHPNGYERALSFTTRHYEKTVFISSGRPPDTGSITGEKGAYPIERVDRQLVEAEVVKLVRAVMES
jgi:hypothetical protein